MSKPSNTLSALRYLAGLSQASAAEQIGVSPITISNWERGKTTPQPGYMNRIAETYKVSTNVIMTALEDVQDGRS